MIRLRRKFAKQWLKRILWISESRINNGDPDFDDVFFLSRDAAKILLKKWFPNETDK